MRSSAGVLAYLVVALAVLLAYVEALGGPFLWDDLYLVSGASDGGKALNVAESLRAPFWQGDGIATNTSYYRPLVTLSFQLDAAVHGSNAGGYHLTNLLLHLANAGLLFALLRRAGLRQSSAALLAAAWALLPRLAEAAAWISGRTDLLATAFALGALLAWDRSLARRVLASLLVFGGLLAKESAIAAVCALAAQELARSRESRAKSALLALLTPLFVALAAYGALRFWAVGLPSETAPLGPFGRAATILEAVGRYAAMAVDVYRPRAVIGRVGVWSAAGVALGAAVLAATLYLGFRYFRRCSPGVALALGLGFGALLPVLHFVPLPLRTLVADRFLYLPAAALVLGVGPVVDRRLGVRRGAWLAAVAFVASLGVACHRRVALWSDETAFWVETYLETPHTNNAPVLELVGVYYRASLWEDALVLAQRGLEYDDPHRRALRYDVGLCLSRLGRVQEARATLSRADADARLYPEGKLELGMLELRSGDFALAERRFAGLAQGGNPGARVVAARFDDFKQAVAHQQRLAPDADAAERAELAALLGDQAAAARAWFDAARAPGASRAKSRAALLYLARSGSLPALVATAKLHAARFGPLEPELASLVELRRSELEKLVSMRPRLGLPTPASERDVH